jgi:CheY-like chemotaxis protein
MPDAVKERAFEPFFTTKDAGRGTGLGLSTVYGFATQSRGAVTLDSRPGAGTTVTLYLPRGDQPAPPPVDPLGESDGFATEGLHVLLVEDDAEVRAVVQAFLTSLGCTVTSCATGEEALAVVISTLDVGLLLTDIALGAGIGGMELARQAQQHRPALKVLLMSGFASGLLDRPPGWHLLRKPYGRDELGRAIAKVLGH